MIRLGTVAELNKAESFPKELQDEMKTHLAILDDNYGKDRDIIKDLGGYLLVVQSEEEMPEVNKLLNMDLTVDAIPEFVDIIRCGNTKVYTISLILLSSDYAVVLIMPFEITPLSLLSQIECFE